MEEYAKLLTSVAALLGALAWPGTFLVIVLVFRGELKSALNKIPVILDRVRKASLAGVALELDRVADAEIEGGTDKSGKITARQFEAAARIFAPKRVFVWAQIEASHALFSPAVCNPHVAPLMRATC